MTGILLAILFSSFFLSIGGWMHPITNLYNPPHINLEPPQVVWFQEKSHPSQDNKFVLEAHATGIIEYYEWVKINDKGQHDYLKIDGKRYAWQNENKTGTIVFLNPQKSDEGIYQGLISNLYGTAVTNKIHIKMGVLESFKSPKHQKLSVMEGEAVTLNCNKPYGNPAPTVFWLYRDTRQKSVIETIKKRHITTDPDGKLHISFVSSHDTRTNLIYECAVTSPIMPGEHRSGDTYSLALKTYKFPNTMFRPISIMYLSPKDNVYKSGDRLKLMCIFGGRPVPTIQWRKIGGQLPVNKMLNMDGPETDYGKSLIIENLRANDSGVYECRADHITHLMNVTVYAAPHWESEPPKDVSDREGAPIDIYCPAVGDPTPLIEWSMNGILLKDLKPDHKWLFLDGGRTFRFMYIDHDYDTAVYQCNASNPHGFIFANMYVNVEAHPPRFSMPDKRVWKVIQRSNVDFSCDVRAAPKENVVWVDSQNQIIQETPGKIMLFPNYTLRILDVNTADEGMYYCNVSNGYGINRASNKLEVFHPTYFVQVPSPRRLIVEANETVELSCRAVADPRLSIDYIWTRDGKTINITADADKTGTTTLKLNNVKGRDSGNIDCAAVSDVEVKVAGIELLVRDTPNEPIVQDITCNDVMARIKWMRPQANGDPIRKFLVQFNTSFIPDKFVTAYEELNVEHDHYQVDISLSPWVNYNFRVVAVNSYGMSEPGHRNDFVCSPRKTRPYHNPGNVLVEGNEPNNLVIYWDPLEKYDWNAPNMRYLIRYKLTSSKEDFREFIVEDPMANHTIIRDTPTYEQYDVQVISVNDIGECIVASPTHKGFSGENKPKSVVEGVQVEQIHNFSTVTVKWNPYKVDDVNGHFVGYKISYWKNDMPYHVQSFNASRMANSYTIRNLKAITTYEASVRTINKHYESKESERINFTTPEGLPSKVVNLKVRSVGSNSILMSWEIPQQTNGNIRGYFLTFEDLSTNEIEETYVLYRQTHYLHERLNTDTNYKVAVWAQSYGGEGPKVVRPVKTWPLIEPDMPTFEVESNEVGSFEVKWVPSNGTHWKMPGSSFYVQYTKHNYDDWKSSVPITLPNTHIELKGLEENMMYSVIGVAKDGNRTKSSFAKYVRTGTTRPMHYFNDDNFQKAMWFIIVMSLMIVFLLVLCICCFIGNRRSGIYSVKKKELDFGRKMLSESEYAKFLETKFQASTSLQKIPDDDEIMQ
uniref:Neuroglian n=1 Tax=Rhabditophanes sp. KR3021 TaxID=114890 RepID=A0AC35TLA5_9BILA